MKEMMDMMKMSSGFPSPATDTEHIAVVFDASP